MPDPTAAPVTYESSGHTTTVPSDFVANAATLALALHGGEFTGPPWDGEHIFEVSQRAVGILLRTSFPMTSDVANELIHRLQERSEQ